MNSIDPESELDSPVEPSSLIDRRSTIPLYHQLFLDLRDRLYSGQWKAGQLFLRDADIENAYQVSRITVRKAMESLVDRGLVVRFRGKGTFVAALPESAQTKISQSKPLDFTNIDGEYRKEVLEISKVPVSKQTAEELHVPDNHMVSIMRLLHWADDVPICLEAIFVDNFRWPEVFDREAVKSEDIAEIYKQRGMEVSSIRQSVSAVIPAAETAKRLALEPGQPSLYISRVSYTAAHVPIDLRLIHCRGDRFVLTQDIQP